MNLLNIQNLSISYGGIRAVNDINLHIKEGELVTLIGANGAGKTTTLKSIVGWVKPRSGSIEFNGINLHNIPTHQCASKGLVLVPEGRGIFPRLTVFENLEMGAFHRKDKHIDADIDHAYQLFPRLKERSKQLAGTLSGGEQQMLAIGRAIISKPKLLLLDEPSMGLAPIIVEQIFDIIRTISQNGVTILLVEQNAKIALEVSHRGYVMESGKITIEGDAQTLLNDERILNAYLGG